MSSYQNINKPFSRINLYGDKSYKNRRGVLSGIRKISQIFHAPIDSKEGDEAEILSIHIEKYEDENYPIEAPDANSGKEDF